MRIWHQSLTVIEDLPAYADRIRQHIATIVRPDTEVVLHGLLPGTYPANYPVTTSPSASCSGCTACNGRCMP